jgi:hypothetical protein
MFFDVKKFNPDSDESGFGFDGYGSSGGGLSYLLSQVFLIYIHIYIYICIFICIYKYMSIYTCIHMHIYI